MLGASVLSVLKETFLFVLAGLCEIGGGWLVWQTLREAKPWWWMAIGLVVLALYGVIPTLQDVDNFGRIFAVYGGYFILLSLLWGWLFDGKRPDTGDILGSAIAMVGVLVMFYYPLREAPLVTQTRDTEPDETTVLL